MNGKRDGELAPSARLCCFLGYSNTPKAYKLWDPIDRTVVISEDSVGRQSDQTCSYGRLHSIPQHAWHAEIHTSIGQGTSLFVHEIVRHHCGVRDCPARHHCLLSDDIA